VGGEGIIVTIGGSEKPFGTVEHLKVVALGKDQRQIRKLLAELRRRKASGGDEFHPREIDLPPADSPAQGGMGTF
jgi:hypothetical protein